MAIKYEWSLETMDGEDIIDSDFSEKLSYFTTIEKDQALVLVRNEGNEAEGLQDRLWAYVNDKKLPEYFSNSMQSATQIKVPVKFHKELAVYFK